MVGVGLCSLLVVSEGFAVPSIGLTAASLIKEMGLSRSEFGLSVTALMAGFFVGTLVGGVFGDRYGQKRAVIISFLAVGVFSALGALMTDYALLLGVRAGMGLGLGAALAPIFALAASQVDERFRGRAIAIASGGGAVGGLLAAVLVGVGGEAITWRVALWALAALATVFLPVFVILTPGARASGDQAPKPDPRRILFGDGRLAVTILLAAANFCLAFNMNGIASWAPALLSGRGIPQQAVGFAAGIIGPCAIVASFAYATLFDRGYRRTAVIIAVVGAVPALGVFFMATTSEIAFVAMGLLGCTVIASQLLLYAIVPLCYPSEGRATGMSASLAAGRLGGVAAPIALGLALDWGAGQPGLLALMLPAEGLALLSILLVLARPSLKAPPGPPAQSREEV